MKTRYLILALVISIVGCKKIAVAADHMVIPAKAGIQPERVSPLPGFAPSRE